MPSPAPPKPPNSPAKPTKPRSAFWDLLTFDRLLTGPVVHIIYWCGLSLIILTGFAVIGLAVGLAIRGVGLEKLIALPTLIAGLLLVLGFALLWRAVCEFYVAVFRISEDLRLMRESGRFDPAQTAGLWPHRPTFDRKY